MMTTSISSTKQVSTILLIFALFPVLLVESKHYFSLTFPQGLQHCNSMWYASLEVVGRITYERVTGLRITTPFTILQDECPEVVDIEYFKEGIVNRARHIYDMQFSTDVDDDTLHFYDDDGNALFYDSNGNLITITKKKRYLESELESSEGAVVGTTIDTENTGSQQQQRRLDNTRQCYRNCECGGCMGKMTNCSCQDRRRNKRNLFSDVVSSSSAVQQQQQQESSSRELEKKEEIDEDECEHGEEFAIKYIRQFYNLAEKTSDAFAVISLEGKNMILDVCGVTYTLIAATEQVTESHEAYRLRH